jgi:hypothetical protein
VVDSITNTWARQAILVLVSAVLAGLASVAPGAPLPVRATVPLSNIRMVNYFPANHPQGEFWKPANWSPSSVDSDFALLASIHANSVRIFVPTKQFGYPEPGPPYTTELAQLVQLAANHQLAVYLTLFNYEVPYSDIPGSQQWARGLLAPYLGDSRLVAIEIQNEIDPQAPGATSWARAMIPYIRSVDGGVPVAVSICGCDNIADLRDLHRDLGSDQPDLYSFHYYDSANNAANLATSVFQQAKNEVAPIPLSIGETGLPTGMAFGNAVASAANSSAEQQQALFFAGVVSAARNVGLSPPAPWILYDFAATPGISLSKDDYYGLYRRDGGAKPAVAIVAGAFGS